MREDPPDPRRAAAEAVHAVESVACLITGTSTLGKAIQSLRNGDRISSGLASTLSKLWGFANDTVRHGSPDGPEISVSEARYMKELAIAALRLLLTLDTAT